MSVNLPDKTETVEQDDLPKDQLIVAVCKDGTVALNRKALELEELGVQVRKRLRSRKDKVVFVDGHPDAPYDNVIQLMDTVRDAGAEKLGMASLKTESDFRACPSEVSDTPVPVEGTNGADESVSTEAG